MKCSKCGYDNYVGQYCQNCGEKFKMPTWVKVMTVINFLLTWVMGAVCISMVFIGRTYLQQGDLVKYQKWLSAFKVVSIIGVIVGTILTVVYIYLKSMIS